MLTKCVKITKERKVFILFTVVGNLVNKFLGADCAVQIYLVVQDYQLNVQKQIVFRLFTKYLYLESPPESLGLGFSFLPSLSVVRSSISNSGLPPSSLPAALLYG